MRILVTGSKGQLGKSIQALEKHYDYHIIYTDVEELDICDPAALDSFFEKNPVDVLLNCAAFTHVDLAQKERETAFLINGTAVGYLARMSAKYGFHLLHISTDYVFNGKNYRPLTEDYKPTPVNVYGKSKLAGEEAIAKHATGATIIRTSWLYSEYGNNFLNTMLRLAREKEQIKVVFDQIGTPTYAGDLAAMILDILPQIVDNQGVQLFHYSGEGVISWYDFAKAIFEIAGIEVEVLPIESSEYLLPAARPFFSVLNKAKIKKYFQMKIPYWRDSLKTCIRKLDKMK